MTAKDRSRLHRGYKRFLRQLKTKRQKRRKAQILCEENARYNRKNGVILSVDQLLSNTLSPSVSYLLNCISSPLNYELINKENNNTNCYVEIPRLFSLIENPQESYSAIRKLIVLSLFSNYPEIFIDYTKCDEFTLEAQVLLDLILKDIFRFYNRCRKKKRFKKYAKRITDRSTRGSSIRTMLFSVGSLAIL